jgi:hypothetical protein
MKSATVVEYQSAVKLRKSIFINFTPAAGCFQPPVPLLASDARNSTFLLPGFLNSSEYALVVSLCAKTNRVLKTVALLTTCNHDIEHPQGQPGNDTVGRQYDIVPTVYGGGLNKIHQGKAVWYNTRPVNAEVQRVFPSTDYRNSMSL